MICGCGKALGPKNKSGCCRSCVAKRNNADPAVIAARKAGILRHHADPAVRAASAARLASHLANMSDEEKARRSEHGRRMYAEVLSRPEVRARNASPEVRRMAGAKRSETVLADIPRHLRDEYRRLTRSTTTPAAEARRMVIEADQMRERRRLAAMTPHERAMERVRNGAAVIAKPVLRKADHAFTLGGIASGAL